MNQHNPEYDYDLTQRSLPGVAASERAAFLTKTYTHLLLAIVAFIALEVVIFQLGWAAPIANLFLKGGQMGWLLVLGGFVLVGMVATRFAASAESRSAQYFGLGLYIVAEALIFVPLLFVAAYYADDPNIIGNSAIVTLVGFTALSMIVFITRKDFSFLRGLLMWGTIAAFGFILYIGVGVWALAMGGNFLDYDALFREEPGGHLGQHVGIIVIELGVLFAVAGSMVTIYYAFAGRVSEIRDEDW